MQKKNPENPARAMAGEILGYLNFSAGATDPKFFKNLSALYGECQKIPPSETPCWQRLGTLLREELRHVADSSEAFRSTEQAEAVLALVFGRVLPGYRLHHRDLLFHQTEEFLFQPFFIGRTCEAVLRQGSPWNEIDRIVPGVLQSLNDYLGYRPIPVLRTRQKIQPYDHERVRPIPLYLRGAGVAFGPHQRLIETALGILERIDPQILFAAQFPLEQLDELAVDPRAYDFDHPVNKRPNYLFGQWDLHCLDNAGRARRFVLQQAALEAIGNRLEDRGDLSPEEALFEEAAVLAGTMLMGAGTSGSRPDAHDSTVTLPGLVQKIADYRDAFYHQLLDCVPEPHAARLRAEAETLKQPFGAARQHFNHFLARRRAEQMQRANLAKLFARMGYLEAAGRQTSALPVASVRMNTEIQCRFSDAHREIDRGRLEPAVAALGDIEDLLHRAIACGAIVDPWYILGFGGQFSLFPAPENSIHDHRVDELIDLVVEIFNLYIRLQKEAAARGRNDLPPVLGERLRRFAAWWDRFASTEVSEVEGCSGQETCDSAEKVVAALQAWHQAGAAAGDIAFWRRHVEEFRSAKAYSLVVDTLLEHRDPVAAMALLMQWLSQAEEISLVEDTYSFHELALTWMQDLWEPQSGDGNAADGDSSIVPAEKPGQPPADASVDAPAPLDRRQCWALGRKFLDFLEANAGPYWRVPHLELGGDGSMPDGEEAEEPLDGEEELYGAAYEQMTYRDSTDDGIDSSLFETAADPAESELVFEAERITDHLSFLATVAHLWKVLATVSKPDDAPPQERDAVLDGWRNQAEENLKQLYALMAAVERHSIPSPRGTHDSMVEYDRRRSVKELLLENIINTCVDLEDAARMIRAAMEAPPAPQGKNGWEAPAQDLLRAVLRGDAASTRKPFDVLLRQLRRQPMLYKALARGGSPQRIAAARSLHALLRRLLAYLPRLGLVIEAVRLLETLQALEFEHPVGPGAITEFDRAFAIGCKAVVRCLVLSAEGWPSAGGTAARQLPEEALIALLEQTIEILLQCWLAHSRGVRLSVLETVADDHSFRQLRTFIERYGRDIFTQYFMNLGNLRAILLEGVDAWIDALQELPDAEEHFQLLDALDREIDRPQAVDWLGAVVEAVVENYSEYIDYNSITTQSDHGEMLYTFLDFLRLRAHYDRVAWNLRPVLLTHEVLVRCDRRQTAETWRKAVADRTRKTADDALRRLRNLSRKYGMKLPSIAERLEERFVKPLLVDRLRALVPDAMEEVRDDRSPDAFPQLEKLVDELTRKVSGAGFELPEWLAALQDEVQQVISPIIEDDFPDPYLDLPQVRLSLDEIRRQLRRLGRTT
jgi:hypothetical protein